MTTSKTTDLSVKTQPQPVVLQAERLKAIQTTLTEKEFKVLFLYSAGYSRAYISDTLNISINTVPDYFARLKVKLNANSVSELRAVLILRLLENKTVLEIFN